MSEVVSPVILPGITGSVLHDEYEMPPEAVWTTGVPVRLRLARRRRQPSATSCCARPGPGTWPRSPARVVSSNRSTKAVLST